MNTELESKNIPEYQEIILLMKNMGLIKDKSKQWQFHNKIWKIYYE